MKTKSVRNTMYFPLTCVLIFSLNACGDGCGWDAHAVEETSASTFCDYDVDSLVIATVDDERNSADLGVEDVEIEGPGCKRLNGKLADGTSFSLFVDIEADNESSISIARYLEWSESGEIFDTDSMTSTTSTLSGGGYLIEAEWEDEETGELLIIELQIGDVDMEEIERTYKTCESA